MHFIWPVAGLLLLVFSITLSIYLVNYKLRLTGRLIKLALIIVIAFIIFIAASCLFIISIWPPNILPV